MSRKRSKTIKAILSGLPMATMADPKYGEILGEINELYRVESINIARRKNILKVLHATRALDTTLQLFLEHHLIRSPDEYALGPYLKKLTNHSKTGLGRLSENSRLKYQAKVVDKRNSFLHTAGKYPTGTTEVNEIIGEIESCLVEIAAL